MENLVAAGVLICLGLVVGAIMGWVAFFKLSALSDRLLKLERQLESLKRAAPKPDAVPTAAPIFVKEEGPESPLLQTQSQAQAIPQTQADPAPTPTAAATRAMAPSKPSQAAATPQQTTTTAHHRVPPVKREHWLSRNIKAHWMVWLGGICIGFAGVFLVKHSIEQGLLGPGARISLAIVMALALHGVAEYLLRKTGKPSDACAALAGGASLMLYAALLAGLHLYQLVSPGLTFAALIIVSLGTMLLALRQGPVLAAIGILGAFSIPLLVSTGSQSVAGALIYSFVITVSALLLIRYVFRPWLWIGTLAGALGWWLLGLASSQHMPWILPAYLVALAYCAMAIDRWNWRLCPSTETAPDQGILSVFRDAVGNQSGRLAILFVLVALLQSLGTAFTPVGYHELMTAAALPILFFFMVRQDARFSALPWLSLMGVIAGLLARHVLFADWHGQTALPWLLIELSALFTGLSLWTLQRGRYPGLWASLAYLSPVLMLAVGYLCIDVVAGQWRWSLAAALLGAAYMHLVFRQNTWLGPPDHTPDRAAPEYARAAAQVVSLTLAAHLAFSLALVILLREATLTLALAVQVISLTWLHRRFALPALQVAAKVVLAVVLARLSLNPWLDAYPTDVHWSLWTYGGALLCCLTANRLAAHDQFKQWLAGASMHLLVLMLAFEVRYWLYDGNVFANNYSFVEAAINTSLWGAMGLVYYWRAQFSDQLRRVYQLAANILMILALGNFILFVVLEHNPLLSDTAVSATPLFNILLLAYGLPVLLFICAYRLLPAPYRTAAGTLAGLSLLLFCSLEIRHLWQGELSLANATSDGELYTYSMVWLALAISGSVWAIRFSHSYLYKGCMLLLIAVIAKIFLIDMDGLTGLLRAASFLGLGLSLLGLAFLHQQFRDARSEPEAA